MQLAEVVHDTPVNSPPSPAAGFGLAMIDQLVPFHRSTNVWRKPSGPSESPTATQRTVLVHVTAFSCGYRSPVGLGVGGMDHFAPFQRSTKVLTTPELVTPCEPT